MSRDAIHTDSREILSAVVRARSGVFVPAGGED